ncbi:hypothetical protein OK016_22415 [Vibrio chagasii]|nr:hypothetical protein [Vibrio chagasii]
MNLNHCNGAEQSLEEKTDGGCGNRCGKASITLSSPQAKQQLAAETAPLLNELSVCLKQKHHFISNRSTSQRCTKPI